MKRQIEKLIRRWGTSLTLQRQGECYGLRGFLQHSNSKSLQNLQKEFSPLGQIPGGWYVYIGPARPEVMEGDVLILGEKSFRICRAEKVMLRDEPLYFWGLCMERGGEDTWGQE